VASSTVSSIGTLNGPKFTLLPFIKAGKEEEELPIREILQSLSNSPVTWERKGPLQLGRLKICSKNAS